MAMSGSARAEDGPLGMAHRGRPHAYGEGERVFAPPQGTFDAAWVARLLQEARPALPPGQALAMVEVAWEALLAGTAADVEALMAAVPTVPGEHRRLVAETVLDAARVYDALP